MKRIFGLLFLLVAFNVSAIEINSKLSGVWWNANQNGHGLNIVTLDENDTLIYWYTYRPDGTSMFLITVGQNEGDHTTGNTYLTSGMQFGEFDPNDLQEEVWGTTTVTFSDCNTASLQYSSSDPSYGNGTISMTRIASVAGLKCSDSPLHGTYMATLVEQGETGFGLATLFENGDMFYYARSDSEGTVGEGQWRVTGTNSFAFDATSYSVFGGWLDISGNGTFNEDALTATYTGNGQLVAAPIPSFQHSLDTSKMAGEYTIYDGFDMVIGTATVQSDGRVSGSTDIGCLFVGALTVPNTSFNQAYFDVDVSDCASTTEITGAAVYDNAQDAIVVAANEGWYGYIWTFRRES